MRCAHRWVLATAMLLSAAQPCVAEARGVVVELIERGSVGERIGLRVGDHLMAWIRRSGTPAVITAKGQFASPFDARTFEYEIAPRAGVSIRVERDARSLWLALSRGRWGVNTAPTFSGWSEAAYQQGADFARAGKIDDAAAQWRQLSATLGPAEPVLACWLLWRVGSLLDSADRIDTADQAFQEALAQARPLEQPSIDAQLVYSRATVYLNRERLSDAVKTLLKESADLWEGVSGRGLAWAWVYARYARTLERPGADSPSSRALREVLAVQLRLAGAGYPTAQTYNTLALNLLRAGQFAAAQELFQKARTIHARYSPVAGDHASVLNNMAMVAMRRGNFVLAERLLDQADRIDRNNSSRTFPPRPDSSMALENHGIVALERGDLSRAEDLHLRALALAMQEAPDGVGAGGIMQNLGLIAQDRGDLAAAESWFARAFAISERRATLGSLEHASVLENRRDWLRRSGALPEAEAVGRQVVEIVLRQAPGTSVLAGALMGLGEVQLDQNRYPDARVSFEQGLRVPALTESPIRFKLLHLLAKAERAEHDYSKAEAHIREAVAIRTAISPQSGALAAALHTLGLVLRDRGRFSESLFYLIQAVDVVERQRARLGASDDAAATFSATVAAVYQDCIDLLVERGRQEDAFAMLERSRARAFLQRLAERDLMFGGDIPETLRSQRVYAEGDLHRAQQRLADTVSTADPTTVKKLRAEITQLQAQVRTVEQRIKQRSPSLAALQYPRPLTLTATRRSLPSGTVLLSYSVGAARTHLFVVQPPGEAGARDSGLKVFTIDVTRDQLQQAVATFANGLKTRPGADAGRALADVRARASALYRQLVSPAEGLIAPAARLLVVADGPLHGLPFGALVRDDSVREGYLMSWKPITTVASMTVYAQVHVKASAPARYSSRISVAAFGDPLYPVAAVTVSDESRGDGVPDPVPGDAEVIDAVRSGLKLERLSATRVEAQAIARLYRPQSVAYVGGDATEERAKQLPRATRVVHYAVHAMINNRFPLNSALAFTIPDRRAAKKENGLLQAWEILDQVRLDADLVTLSACETAVGQEAGGDGLLSLTRAFHHAGARTVLASLWRVDDQATSSLMQQFYARLRSGVSKDNALREAQRAMASEPRWSHPFYWAAFQLSGAGD
jgi:CHAT domain-containing protein/Flp pilus assembly protein TadD